MPAVGVATLTHANVNVHRLEHTHMQAHNSADLCRSAEEGTYPPPRSLNGSSDHWRAGMLENAEENGKGMGIAAVHMFACGQKWKSVERP